MKIYMMLYKSEALLSTWLNEVICLQPVAYITQYVCIASLHFTATFSLWSVLRTGRTWLGRWLIRSSRIQKWYQLCLLILIIPVSAFWERKLLFWLVFS